MAVSMGANQSELIGAEGPRSDATQSAPLAPGSEIGAPWSEAAPAGDGPVTCKFLRSIGPDGKLSDPGPDAVPTHRCAAFGDPLPLSLRQQELVCLQRVHVSCPRYMRGTLLAEESEAGPAVEAKPKLGVPYLTIAGLVLLALAGVVAIAGMLGVIPGTGNAPASPSGIAAVSASPSQSPSPVPSDSATPNVTASVAPSPTLAPTATPVATATPFASPTWPPGATASRMKLLTPCTNQANCYIYVVRGPGPSGNGSSVTDTVSGIANFFGVKVQAIYDLNPWAKSGIKAGDQLKIPPPTR